MSITILLTSKIHPHLFVPKIFSILYLLVISNLILAQEKILTYDEAISIAVEQNITIQQQKNLLKTTKVGIYQRAASFLPTVSASFDRYRTDGRQWSNDQSAMVTSTTDGASFSIGADLVIFNGFRKFYSLKQSEQLYKAQENQVERSTQDVIFQTSNQFLQILLDKELLLIAEKDYDVNRNQYEQIQSYTKIGIRTSSDLLTQEAQLKRSEVNVLIMKNRLRSDRAIFTRTLMLQPDKEFDIVSPTWNLDSLSLINYSSDSLIQTALEQHPDVLRIKEEENAAKQLLHATWTGHCPTVGIYYNYGSYWSQYPSETPLRSFNQQLFSDNINHSYGLYVRIPIFNQMQNRLNVVNAKISYENTKLTHSGIELQMRINVSNAYNDFLFYKERFNAAKVLVDATTKTYEKQQELYRMGRSDIVALNIENQRYIDAQAEKVQAEYTLLFQHIILDYHVGILKTK